MLKKAGGRAPRALSGRQAKYGSLATAHVLLVIGILTAVNYAAARHHTRWDLTGNRIFTLSDQTRTVLKRLAGPARFHVFARQEDFEPFRARLREYEYLSKDVSAEYIDLDEKPALAKQYQVQTPNTVILEYEGRTERTTSGEEQDLTGAILKAIEARQKKAYFVQGHGERDTGGSQRDGYSAIAAAMASDNFAVGTLVLAQKDVPADAAVVIIAGPKMDLVSTETDRLKRYLARGGRLLVLIDPPSTPQEPPRANVVSLLRDWDFDVGNNVVIDMSGMGQLVGTDATVPIAAKYPPHPITERFDSPTAFPFACSITPIAGGMPGGYVAQTFIETSEKSFTETHIAKLLSTGHAALDENTEDRQGPISLGAAVSAKVQGELAEQMAREGVDIKNLPETRIAVIGDSDFIANATLGLVGNHDLFLNTVNWVARQEGSISIRPREADDRRVRLAPAGMRRVFWLSVLVIPGLVFGTGVFMWWRRR